MTEGASRAKWIALGLIGGGGSLIIAGAVVWTLFGQTAAGAALAAAGAAAEATGVVKLIRALRKN